VKTFRWSGRESLPAREPVEERDEVIDKLALRRHVRFLFEFFAIGATDLVATCLGEIREERLRVSREINVNRVEVLGTYARYRTRPLEVLDHVRVCVIELFIEEDFRETIEMSLSNDHVNRRIN
jgi:hypothetical protein